MNLEKIESILYYTIIVCLVISIGIAILCIVYPLKLLLYILFAGNSFLCVLVFLQYTISSKSKKNIVSTINKIIETAHAKAINEIFELAHDKINDMNNTICCEDVQKLVTETDSTIKNIELKSSLPGKINNGTIYEYYEYIYKEIICGLLVIIYEYHRKLISLYQQLETLCPTKLPLLIAEEWNEFIDTRFTSSFELVKDSIQLLQKIQAESIEYVQYVLEILKGFKDKRAVQYDQMIGFYAKMRNTQESFAQYLSTVSQTFQFIKEIMVQVEEITDKINILSLNMSIEANKLTGNNVFAIIAKELHTFSEQTIKFFEPMKKTIEQNLNTIEEKKKEEQDALAQIQEFINLSEKMIKEYEENIDQFTRLVDNVSKALITQDEGVKGNLFKQFEDIQKLVIIKEEMDHRDKFTNIMLHKVNNTIQKLIREHKVCQGVQCEYRIDSFKLLESLITTADEREFLKKLYKKYLHKELDEDEHKQGDVILF
ncbi:MAG: methyl-accepting chemotaxis protein [Spirochaetota bacterium]